MSEKRGNRWRRGECGLAVPMPSWPWLRLFNKRTSVRTRVCESRRTGVLRCQCGSADKSVWSVGGSSISAAPPVAPGPSYVRASSAYPWTRLTHAFCGCCTKTAGTWTSSRIGGDRGEPPDAEPGSPGCGTRRALANRQQPEPSAAPSPTRKIPTAFSTSISRSVIALDSDSRDESGILARIRAGGRSRNAEHITAMS
jgi:hypothetical protein